MKRFFSKVRAQSSRAFYRAVGKERHASNPNYKIHKVVYRQLQTGDITAQMLLPKLASEPQRELLDNVCNLANERRAGHLPSETKVEELRRFIAEHIEHMTTEYLDRIEQISISSGLFTLACAAREENERLLPPDARIRHQRPRVPNHEFLEYIKSKRVALVGPAPSITGSSQEIREDFHIIVRLNYRGVKTLPASQRDLTPQVVYYRKYLNALLADPSVNIDFLKNIDFVVLKQHDAKALQRVRRYTSARVARFKSNELPLGRFGMLQFTIHDLLLASPSRLKVFGATLDLSQSRYAKGYKTIDADHGTLMLWQQMSSHNLISQYDYVRGLYLQEQIEADDSLAEILNLGRAEYMNQIQKQENEKSI